VSTLPTQPPTQVEAGTTVRFTQAPVTTAFGDVGPATGWSLVYLLRGPGEANATATDDGVLWTVSLPATVTSTLAPGGYTWALRASAGADVVTLAQGACTVTIDMAQAVAGDVQTWEERTLAVVEAALHGNLSDSVQSYMIGDQQVQKIPIEKLMVIRAQLQSAVAQQRSASGFGRAVRMTAVFTR